MGVCHCITTPDTICYVVAKTVICNIFVNDPINTVLIKSNTYMYKKEQKEKVLRSKTTTQMEDITKKMESADPTETQLTPIVHMTNTMVDDYYDENQSDESSSSESE